MTLFRCDHAPLIAQLRADLAAADARADAAEARYLAERERYDALLVTTLAMKTAGAPTASVVGGVLEHTPVAAAEPDELRTLIAERCGTNVGLRSIMLRQLAKDRAAGLADEKIRAAIERGVSSDGVAA